MAEFSMTCTMHHLRMSRSSSTNWCNQFTILNINLKPLHLHSTSNFALGLDNFKHHPTVAPYQIPETTVPWLPLLHLENVKTIATPISPSQNSSDPEWLEFQKVEQKQNVPTNQMTACQLALDPLD